MLEFLALLDRLSLIEDIGNMFSFRGRRRVELCQVVYVWAWFVSKSQKLKFGSSS